jgi:cytochrome P450 family 6
MSVFKLNPTDPKISKYFRSMVEHTVNYRERNNIKRNDFMQLLIHIKNKVKLDEENENIEENDHGTLDNKSAEGGIYCRWVDM